MSISLPLSCLNESAITSSESAVRLVVSPVPETSMDRPVVGLRSVESGADNPTTSPHERRPDGARPCAGSSRRVA